eukprot:CAMPEP_0170516784 /NCGR_PEP_ID=MMETSP0209-20121228/2925_1 /TAXON_ID=665100 ORGANISM="Litonotus pictus, Strain P1" /NCGR_SAMPLE_ID=MMETSP0209 /ASSEMBLY_ACC=CAM_ASM_000301 /LENGTH=337 /DNA_ID=CAMNT_0010801815 /DNA_START=92 /DNA_END=1101 /DNA_ORIENTATION=+
MKMVEDKPIKEQFKVWHYSLKRPYDLNSDHGEKRFQNFKKNFHRIQDSKEKNLNYQIGLGPFADMDFEEFKESILLKQNSNFKNSDNVIDKPLIGEEGYFDYFANKADNEKGFLWEESNQDYDYDKSFSSEDWSLLFPLVRDQKSCGSCWAFATAAVVEAFYVLENGGYKELSTQQLLDCTGKANCEGGLYKESFNYYKNNDSVEEKNYPYQNIQGKCQANKLRGITRMNDYTFTEQYKKGFAEKTILKGPYAAAVYVDYNFMLYSGGIFSPNCTTKESDVNHAVVVVQLNNEYIKIRNSWGSVWGEKGYMRIERNPKNNYTCFLEQILYQPTSIKS